MRGVLLVSMILTMTSGTSFAETTGNQLNSDNEEGFLDGVYNFPNIHSHQSFLPNDTNIYSGRSNRTTEATETIDVDVGEGNVLDAINWSVDVSNGAYCVQAGSYDCNGSGVSGSSDTITIELEFMDTAGSVLDTAGPGTFSLAYTDGGWNTYSGIYDDGNHLGDITSLAFTIGGIDSANNPDGVRFNGMSVTYDYSEEVVQVLLSEEIVDDVIEQLLDQGVDEGLIDDMFNNTIDVGGTQVAMNQSTEDDQQEEQEQEESSSEESETESESESEEGEVEEDTEEEGDTEESEEEPETEESEEGESEEKDEKEGEEKDESKDEGESSKSDDSSSSNNSGNVSGNGLGSVSSGKDNALALVEMINSINQIAGIGLSDQMDFTDYTSLTMEDAVELEDNEDWYQNQAIYQNQNMPDSNILDGYDKQLTEGKFYGSNNQFY